MTNGRFRTVWAAASIAGALVLVALLAVLANANTAQRVSANAATLHRTNATLGSAALTRAAAGQVALFQDLVERGVASEDALSASEAELDVVADALATLTSDADAQTQLLAETFLQSVEIRPLAMGTVETAYAPLKAELSEAIVSAQTAIETSENSAQRLYVVLRVAVTLIIPVAVVLYYRRRSVMQVRQARNEMKLAVESERKIAKAKSEFVAGLSHEMRTPLTGIYGFTEVLLDTVDDDEVRAMVAEIYRESSDLTRMVDDFIAMSRLDSESLTFVEEPVDIGAVARSLSDQYGAASEGREAGILVQGDASLALADTDKVRQVVNNLLANAVRYGGDEIIVSVSDGGGTVVCEVIDNGAGVPDEMEGRLFARFIHDGTEVLTRGSHGLGTWVAWSLTERMGGSLVYHRRDGQTVFTVTLPAAPRVPVSDDLDTETLVSA